MTSFDPTAPTADWRQAWTIAVPLEFAGVGVHAGLPAAVRLVPASAGHGIVFYRIDLPGCPAIPATADRVCDTRMCTVLAEPGEPAARVATIEHLLAALAGLGVTDVRIEVDGPEVPILDGSARPYVEAIIRAGVVALGAPRPIVALGEISLVEGPKAIKTLPGAAREVTYVVDFEHPYAGPQIFHGVLTPAAFAELVAPARTFGFWRDVEALRAAGLARGGSVENAIVIGEDGYSSPLRFADELVRHKVLDLIGDLALLGGSWTGHVLALKAGHKLHNDLARQVLAGRATCPAERGVTVD